MSSVDWSPDTIQGWAKHTDSGDLRHLCLGGGYASCEMRERGMDKVEN